MSRGTKFVTHIMSDHVHLVLSMPPKYSISQIMWYLKEKMRF